MAVQQTHEGINGEKTAELNAFAMIMASAAENAWNQYFQGEYSI